MLGKEVTKENTLIRQLCGKYKEKSKFAYSALKDIERAYDTVTEIYGKGENVLTGMKSIV